MSEFNYGIELERQLYGNTVDGRTLAYRMTVRVTRSYGVDPNIFLYKRESVGMGGNPPVDTFVAVCTPVDIEEYLVGAPREGDNFFRVADIDLLARNAEQLEDIWRLICIDRDELIRTLQDMHDAQGTQTSAYGDFGEESSSPSSGEEGSSTPESEAPACNPFMHSSLQVTLSDHPGVAAGLVLDAVDNDPVPPGCEQMYEDEQSTVRVVLSSPAGEVRTFAVYLYQDGQWNLFATDAAGDHAFIAISGDSMIQFTGV